MDLSSIFLGFTNFAPTNTKCVKFINQKRVWILIYIMKLYTVLCENQIHIKTCQIYKKINNWARMMIKEYKLARDNPKFWWDGIHNHNVTFNQQINIRLIWLDLKNYLFGYSALKLQKSSKPKKTRFSRFFWLLKYDFKYLAKASQNN